MRKIKEFLKLNLKEKSLLVITYFMLIAASILTRIMPFKFIARILKNKNANDHNKIRDEEDKLIQSITRFIIVAANHIPWKVKCLAQAVVGKLILNYYNIPSKMFLGVRKKENGESIEAHAWVKVNDDFVTGHFEQKFSEIVSF